MAILKKKATGKSIRDRTYKKEADEVEEFSNYWEQVRTADKLGLPIPPAPPGTEAEMSENLVSQKKDVGIGFFARWKIRRKPETTYLIRMEFSNGTERTWVINAKEETFRYRGRMYYLRFEDSRYDVTQSMQKLHYHEDYVVPISKEIVKLEDPSQPPGSESARAWFSVVPSNVRDILKQEYVKVLAQSQELSKYLKAVTVLSVLIILLMVGNLYLTLRGRGSI